MPNMTFAVLGAGSWGTAVAMHLSMHGQQVLLWGRDANHIQSMAKSRENTRYLPGITLPESLTPEANLQTCLTQATHLIIATPSHAFGELLKKLPEDIHHIAWITKGLDPEKNQCLSELVTERWGKDFRMAVISGPSFAKEVAKGLPTALVIAGNNATYAQSLHDAFHHHHLRVYASHDLIGVQCAGAVKNVLAIACGISDGLNYGANAKAALITRGLAEMTRFGTALGGLPETFAGLTGLGDLVLTCTDNQSRNRRFGLLIGQGEAIIAAEKAIGQVVEGKHNASQVCALAKANALELPICHEVNELLQGNISAEDAVKNLLNRPAKKE
ncbi:MAG: NAD(P)-dependent glycerol-3-phosphate dehydrogenase [Gammaproteobacteria bacterium]|nr:NAD(P)-dependent glycerol-3-phosphate dehydrogenase [Gammaproteobacteria bacterium]MCH9716742.1 NAD(P)-dependent glycerol-3-phosphate dehydrogenase [Gammaproteobacteria bacterium]MCH9764201.1 NAD(P)-dependent glycerol-3-phosphate dehydrogenase [Gammaproteobacteria bacterium]MCH9793674.1 NAD(P)-dependent glycerol-3-phosphate dehydrogenase [Planctomycetota bacterium]